MSVKKNSIGTERKQQQESTSGKMGVEAGRRGGRNKSKRVKKSADISYQSKKEIAIHQIKSKQ